MALCDNNNKIISKHKTFTTELLKQQIVMLHKVLHETIFVLNMGFGFNLNSSF